MTILSEIRAAIGDNTATVQTVAAGLTPLQKRAVWFAMAKARLPITVNTVLGTITITNVTLRGGTLTLEGQGVIKDNEFPDDKWHVIVHPPPLFVPDPLSTDLVVTNADSSTSSFRLDPVAAIRSVLGDVIRAQQ